jgi:hypothetical protein
MLIGVPPFPKRYDTWPAQARLGLHVEIFAGKTANLAASD